MRMFVFLRLSMLIIKEADGQKDISLRLLTLSGAIELWMTHSILPIAALKQIISIAPVGRGWRVECGNGQSNTDGFILSPVQSSERHETGR